jgi:hypothetical protein
MSYKTMHQLADDYNFQWRIRACLYEQAISLKDSKDAQLAAMAWAVITDDGTVIMSFYRLAAHDTDTAWADLVDKGDDTVDHTRVSDDDIKAEVTKLAPTVGALFFNADGSRK